MASRVRLQPLQPLLPAQLLASFVGTVVYQVIGRPSVFVEAEACSLIGDLSLSCPPHTIQISANDAGNHLIISVNGQSLPQFILLRMT